MVGPINVTFGEYEEKEKLNPFTEIVSDLSDMTDVWKNEGRKNPPSVTIEVDVNDVAKTKFLVQRAANAISKTARIRTTDESQVAVIGKDENGNDIQSGNVNVTFTITKLHKVRRGNKARNAFYDEEGNPISPEEAAEKENAPSDSATDDATMVEETAAPSKRR